MARKKLLGIVAVVGILLALLVVVLVIALPEEGGPREDQDRETVDQESNDPPDEEVEPVYPSGDMDPTYHRRAATPEELAEDIAEIRRIHQALPGNHWLPPLPGEEHNAPNEEQQKKFSENERLRRKVRAGTATAEEKRRYIEHRKKITADRIALIEYYIKRAQETPDQPWFTRKDIGAGKEKIDELKIEISRLEAEIQPN